MLLITIYVFCNQTAYKSLLPYTDAAALRLFCFQVCFLSSIPLPLDPQKKKPSIRVNVGSAVECQKLCTDRKISVLGVGHNTQGNRKQVLLSLQYFLSSFEHLFFFLFLIRGSYCILWFYKRQHQSLPNRLCSLGIVVFSLPWWVVEKKNPKKAALVYNLALWGNGAGLKDPWQDFCFWTCEWSISSPQVRAESSRFWAGASSHVRSCRGNTSRSTSVSCCCD